MELSVFLEGGKLTGMVCEGTLQCTCIILAFGLYLVYDILLFVLIILYDTTRCVFTECVPQFEVKTY